MSSCLRQAAAVGISLWIVCVGAVFGHPPAGSQPSAAAQRDYDAGPLGPRDFQAAVPEDDHGLDAMTTTDLRYRFRYETRVTGRRASAWITSVEIEAVMISEESWNRHPDNLTLMDHEQGHFDLAQIHALKARLHFAKQRITSNAATVEQAASDVENEMRQQMEQFFKQLRSENQEYDRLTDHGRRDASQREQRQRQQQLLADLTGQWQLARETASEGPNTRPKPAGTRR